MTIHFYSKNEQVKMWSEDEIDAPALTHYTLSISDADFVKLKNSGWTLRIENNQLVWQQHPRITRESSIKNLKEQLKKEATMSQLKDALKEIITLIS